MKFGSVQIAFHEILKSLNIEILIHLNVGFKYSMSEYMNFMNKFQVELYNEEKYLFFRVRGNFTETQFMFCYIYCCFGSTYLVFSKYMNNKIYIELFL